MGFLKDFREELSQAVNELVNMEDSETSDGSSKNEKEEDEKMARKKKKNVTDNTGQVTDKQEKNQEVHTSENSKMEEFESNLDMETLNELFGNEEKNVPIMEQQADNVDNNIEEIDEKIYSEITENVDTDEIEQVRQMEEDSDITLDNIDISDYLEAEQRETNQNMKQSETVIKELARNIQSKMNDDKLEEMMEDDKESRKAALRGMRKEESHTQEDKEESALATEEVAEVTKGTMIDGNIVSEGSMNIYGKIKGNVACRGKLVVCGTIVGSSRGAEIFTNNARIDGDVTSDGSIKIGNGTVIIGNIYGTSAVIAGAVQGDVDIQGPVIIDGTAVIQGNIRSRSVQINNGAAIEGMISQCYADIDYAALFDKTFSQS